MKTLLIVFGIVLFSSCVATKDNQVDVMKAQLIKIDTVVRYPNQKQQLLTWRLTDSNMEYFSYAPIASVYSVGLHVMVLMRK